ncbi:GIY-YIG nuclease family protein [Priestia sp. SB1]|uniref:GIY-YIG nuclease family protein n=1 Tax=Priestia sp. SB1 TaxID=3132359 RepID=UPI0031723BD7
MRESGIYKIVNNINKKVYIGQSIDLKRRLGDHKRELRKNNHRNRHLQFSFNKYGESVFSYEIIEKCSTEELDSRESYWIAEYDSMNKDKGFNLESGGNEGKTYTEERIASITGEGNPMYGKKLSKKQIEFMRETNKGSSNLLTEENVKEIKLALLEDVKMIDLAAKYGVDYTTIGKISSAKNWYWVLPELNSKLKNRERLKRENRNERIIEMFTEGNSKANIMRELGITRHIVDKVLRDVKMTSQKNKKLDKTTINKIIEFNQAGINNPDIAKRLSLNLSTITKYLHRYSLSGKRLGSKHQSSKLTEDLVFNIKKMLYIDKKSPREISELIGIARTTISDIKFERTWKHVILEDICQESSVS